MSVFDPLRRFIRRQEAETMIHRAKSVSLVTQKQEAPRGNFVYPGMEYLARLDVDGQRVGHIDYSLNPLRDRVYINMIEVAGDHRRRGVALGALWQLWQAHQVPIVPVHEYSTSTGFWHLARQRFAAVGGQIDEELRGSLAMETEMQRWAHLVPEPEHERLQRELMASPEWAAIKARWNEEYGPCPQN